MRVLKRVLTRKSILGFGYADYRNLSVQMILDELGITAEYRIVKPNKEYELEKLFFKNGKCNMPDIINKKIKIK